MAEQIQEYDGRTVAVLDIGSNTCRLVIARLNADSGFEIIEETRAAVRLVPAAHRTSISPPALERAERAFREFRGIVECYRPDECVYLATAAVREASNQQRVLRLFSEWLGQPVHVIAAEEECRLAVFAAANAFLDLTGTVVDLGGGSMQVGTYLGLGVTSTFSFPLGALRLQQEYLHRDPPKPRELKRLRSHVRDLLAERSLRFPEPVFFAGGTARALAKIHQRSSGYQFQWAHGYRLTLDQLSRLTERLSELTQVERAQVPGLNPDRADIILPGAVAIEEFCRAMSIHRLVVSGEGIRQGVLYGLLQEYGLLTGSPRDRTIAQLREAAPAPPYMDGAQALARKLMTALGPDPLVQQLVPVAITLHRLGDKTSTQRSDRNAYNLVTSREMAGFSRREAMLLAAALGSQEEFRLRRDECQPPLLPTDLELVGQVSALIRLVVTLARSGATNVAVRRQAGLVEIEASVLPYESDELSERFKRFFVDDLVFRVAPVT